MQQKISFSDLITTKYSKEASDVAVVPASSDVKNLTQEPVLSAVLSTM